MSQSFPDMVRRGVRPPWVTPRRARAGAPDAPGGRPRTALAGVPMFADFSKKHLQPARRRDRRARRSRRAQIDRRRGRSRRDAVRGARRARARSCAATQGGRTVLPGDFFGELSAIDGGPRTASVIAETPMRVLRLFRRTLMSLIEDEPQVTLKLLDGIVRRVRQVERLRAEPRSPRLGRLSSASSSARVAVVQLDVAGGGVRAHVVGVAAARDRRRDARAGATFHARASWAMRDRRGARRSVAGVDDPAPRSGRSRSRSPRRDRPLVSARRQSPSARTRCRARWRPVSSPNAERSVA